MVTTMEQSATMRHNDAEKDERGGNKDFRLSTTAGGARHYFSWVRAKILEGRQTD